MAELRRAVLVEELDGLVFLNPDRYNENNPDIGWETADEYLSGNVRDKLRVAKAMALIQTIRRQKDLQEMWQHLKRCSRNGLKPRILM